MSTSARFFGVLAAMVALLGLTSTTAIAQTPPNQFGLPTVGCSWAVVTLGVEQYCINVYGDGLYVDRVSGELESVSKGPSPVEGAEINLFGTLENGGPHSVAEVAPDGISSATAWFTPGANFRDGSQLCIRTRIGAVEFSEPTCVNIHA